MVWMGGFASGRGLVSIFSIFSLFCSLIFGMIHTKSMIYRLPSGSSSPISYDAALIDRAFPANALLTCTFDTIEKVLYPS
jgi:hypothetical protein